MAASGGYRLELIRRFDPSQCAAFARKRDALLVAAPTEEGYELELLDLKKFKRLGHATIEDFAVLAPVGEGHALVVFPIGSAGKGYDQRMEVRRLKDFGIVASFVEEMPGNLAASPDGTHVVVAHDFGAMNVRDARTGELIYEYASRGVGGVAYSRDGALLAAQEFAGSLKIFDAADLQQGPLRSATVGRGAVRIAFHPQRPLVASAGKTAIKLVDAETGKVTASIKTTKRESRDSVGRITFSPDGRLLVTSTFSEGVVGLWDVEGGEFLGHVLEPDAPLNGVEFDARGEYLLISSYEAAELYAFSRG